MKRQIRGDQSQAKLSFTGYKVRKHLRINIFSNLQFVTLTHLRLAQEPVVKSFRPLTQLTSHSFQVPQPRFSQPNLKYIGPKFTFRPLGKTLKYKNKVRKAQSGRVHKYVSILVFRGVFVCLASEFCYCCCLPATSQLAFGGPGTSKLEK